MKQVFRIDSDWAVQQAIWIIKKLNYDQPMIVTIDKETRTSANNAAQWPILNAFSEQLLWPVNGAMVKMTGEEWKDVLTAAYKQETVRLAMGLDGGVVMLGKRTREFKRSEWSNWMAFIESVAVERDVKIPLSKSRSSVLGFA